jgi:predicted nucleic acid-binding protein
MIISDATTLIILFDLKRVDILSNLFDKILIPQTVYHELSAKKEIILPGFIKVVTVNESDTLKLLKNLLDDGESEAIALAIEKKSRLIIDEKKGRKIAMKQGLKIIGLLGIVYLNIKNKYISQKDAKLFLDDALVHGYRINVKLIETMFSKL